MNIRQEVFESLENARNNGFKFNGLTIIEIAQDICQYNDVFEDIDPSTLVPTIYEYYTTNR